MCNFPTSSPTTITIYLLPQIYHLSSSFSLMISLPLFLTCISFTLTPLCAPTSLSRGLFILIFSSSLVVNFLLLPIFSIICSSHFFLFSFFPSEKIFIPFSMCCVQLVGNRENRLKTKPNRLELKLIGSVFNQNRWNFGFYWFMPHSNQGIQFGLRFWSIRDQTEACTPNITLDTLGCTTSMFD